MEWKEEEIRVEGDGMGGGKRRMAEWEGQGNGGGETKRGGGEGSLRFIR
jgi:hypothetical protein